MSICNNSTGEVAEILPGPKKKQAEALFRNVLWLADTFGSETIGFLTLTFPERIKNRAVASRKFNSVLNRLRERYRCGVSVSERHKSGAIHFHLVVATGKDIRGEVDFSAAFPSSEQLRAAGEGNKRRPDYSTVQPQLRAEWHWLRVNLKRYGFGRHQLQPMRKNAEALARYVGKYISKGWTARTPDDKGARLVNYFGIWSAKNLRRASPPWSARHGGLTPRARAWRECCRQIEIACRLQGRPLPLHDLKSECGKRWAIAFTRTIRATKFFLPTKRDADLIQAMTDSNAEAEAEFGAQCRGIWQRSAEWFFNQPESEIELHKTRLENQNARRLASREKLKRLALVESMRQFGATDERGQCHD